MKMNRRQVLKAGLAASAVYSPWMIARAQARPVKFAAILPLTGAFAFAGNAGLEGFRDAADRINDAGGIGGRRLELVVEDSGYDVARATAAFNRIVQRESPEELVFVYGDSTGTSKALAPEITRLRLPYSATSFSNEAGRSQHLPHHLRLWPHLQRYGWSLAAADSVAKRAWSQDFPLLLQL